MNFSTGSSKHYFALLSLMLSEFHIFQFFSRIFCVSCASVVRQLCVSCASVVSLRSKLVNEALSISLYCIVRLKLAVCLVNSRSVQSHIGPQKRALDCKCHDHKISVVLEKKFIESFSREFQLGMTLTTSRKSCQKFCC